MLDPVAYIVIPDHIATEVRKALKDFDYPGFLIDDFIPIGQVPDVQIVTSLESFFDEL